MEQSTAVQDPSVARAPEPAPDDRVAALQKAAATGTLGTFWARVQPDAPAVLSPTGDRTFAELNSRANQLVRALRARGLQPGDAVALVCSNRPEFVEVVQATSRSGLRLTPVNWHLTADEIAYIVQDCGAVAVVADTRFAETVAAAVAGSSARVLLAVGGPVPGFEDYDAALRAESGEDLEDPQIGTQMLYTSGTTGRPKGVHRSPGATAASSATAMLTDVSGYVPGQDKNLVTGPLYHAAPLAFSLSLPLARGAAAVLMDGWDAEQALALVEQHRITHSHMVPTMFHRLVSLPEGVRRRYDTSSLRFVWHGAAPCPVPVKQALMDWLGPVAYEYYAATEGVGTVVTPQEWLARPGTVGKPDPGHIRILDESGEDLPPGEPGTIYIKAPDAGRFRYFGDEGKTDSAYRGDHFTLGDVGYLDDDGWLFLTDRSVDLIISGGVNVYPAEVEAVLLGHPAVGDVGVIGVPDPEWGESVVAVVELQPGVEETPELREALLAHAREHLAGFKVPRRVDVVEQLPRSDAGKLYKRRLRDQYRAAAGA